jgi:hypothetical protein
MRTWRALVVLGIAALLTSCSDDTTASTRGAEAPSSTTAADGKRVSFTVASPAPTSLTPVCDRAQVCVIPATGTAIIAGDLQGSGVFAGGAATDGAHLAVGNALATFSGTVKGCGEGSQVLRYSVRYAPEKSTGSWEIVDGLGKGALARTTGSGTFVVKVNPDMSSTSTWTGTLVCGQP